MSSALYRLPGLALFPNLIHGFSTRAGSNMSYRWGKSEEVSCRRAAFFADLNIDAKRVVSAELEHGDTILRVGASAAGHGVLQDDYALKADALMTKEPNLFLFHVVADCTSLLYYDPVHEAIGLVHGGRRNTELELPNKVVTRMAEEFGTAANDLSIGLGPAIHACCYAFPQAALPPSPGWAGYCTLDNQGMVHVDNIGRITDQLIQAGVPRTQIYSSNICTGHDEHFFSHYRDRKLGQPDQGRLAAVIGLTT